MKREENDKVVCKTSRKNVFSMKSLYSTLELDNLFFSQRALFGIYEGPM